jgi:glycosyltransferase involved in cell wall biosynthesis
MKEKIRGVKVSVIIPVYNERKTIIEIIKRIKEIKINKEIIIVDDFSTDGTRDILNTIKDPEIKVVYHDKNYGKGHAIRTAIKNVSGDIVIIQDADLEYDPEDYYVLVKPIIDKKANVVYGTRFPKGRSHPSILNPFFLANKILTTAANILFFMHITDEPTCYKVFRADAIKSLNLKCERFEFCPEVTAKIRKSGLKIYEIPIKYNPRSVKEGKKIKWIDGVEGLWTLIKYRFID